MRQGHHDCESLGAEMVPATKAGRRAVAICRYTGRQRLEGGGGCGIESWEHQRGDCTPVVCKCERQHPPYHNHHWQQMYGKEVPLKAIDRCR